MSESSFDLIATVGAVLAFLFAAAAGITSRRGIRLVADRCRCFCGCHLSAR